MTVQFNIHKHRMEALIDGVFAIAMTILVLEVKVPGLADPSSGACRAPRCSRRTAATWSRARSFRWPAFRPR